MSAHEAVKAGDIVQVHPEFSHGRDHQWFNACLVVVTQVYDWGVQGYVQNAGELGVAHVRLNYGTFEHTGGRAVWSVQTAGDNYGH